MNHFKIIVPLYNVQDWVKKCVKSIQLQTYSNYECYLVDDISTDSSREIIKSLIQDDERFVLIENTEKKFALRNIYEAIEHSGDNPEDVIVTLDGDDWFATKKALEILNEVYLENRCFMTYGSYIEFPSMKRGPFCKQIPHDVVKGSTYRQSKWFSSHLRTFKRHLWERIEVSDLKNGDEFFRMTWDMAFMFPMLEMSGPLAIHIDKMLYSYNRQNPLNDDKVNHRLQLLTERHIREKNKYEQDFVIADILGPSGNLSGIGNQLFCVATALGYAYEHSATPIFPQIRTDRFINMFKDTFYKNLNVGREGDFSTAFHQEPFFEFQKIKHTRGALKIRGYFQSYKYFENHRNKILDSLNIHELKNGIKEKYGDYSDFVSIHVRRGDYLHLSQYHYNLQMDYYNNAIEHFGKDSKFLIFSNDIDWCKQEFNSLKNVQFSENKDDWEDIILMSTCRDNVIANSSFSWWGAWLNTNNSKTVIAPSRWFGPAYSNKSIKDLIPEDWITNV